MTKGPWTEQMRSCRARSPKWLAAQEAFRKSQDIDWRELDEPLRHMRTVLRMSFQKIATKLGVSSESARRRSLALGITKLRQRVALTDADFARIAVGIERGESAAFIGAMVGLSKHAANHRIRKMCPVKNRCPTIWIGPAGRRPEMRA